MPRPSKARKVDEDQRERLLAYLNKVPPQDAMIMAGGAIAGSQGYTPMTMMLKALKGGSLPSGINDVLPLALPGQFFNPVAYYSLSKMLADVLVPSGSDNASASTQRASDAMQAFYRTAALASVGMIESYMITRPGAFGAVLNMVQSGVTGIAGLAKEGGAALL